MRRLAAEVGMSKSGLYAHFASKEELQLATIEHVCGVFQSKVLHGPPDGHDNDLGPLLKRWLAFFEHKVFPGGCFLVAAAVEFANRQGPVRDALAAALDREVAALEMAIGQANEAGELDAQKDPGQTAFALHSVLVNADSLFQVRHDRAVFDDARATIGELLAEPPRPRRSTSTVP